MAHFVAFFISFQKIIPSKIPPGGGTGVIGGSRTNSFHIASARMKETGMQSTCILHIIDSNTNTATDLDIVYGLSAEKTRPVFNIVVPVHLNMPSCTGFSITTTQHVPKSICSFICNYIN